MIFVCCQFSLHLDPNFENDLLSLIVFVFTSFFCCTEILAFLGTQNSWVGGWVDGWMDGVDGVDGVDGWMEWMDGWMEIFKTAKFEKIL